MNLILPIVRSLPLVGDDQFAAINDLIGGHTVWYATGPGNAGDTLIHAGARCLFRRINTLIVEARERPDFIVWGGGGNLGTFWRGNYDARQGLLRQAQEMGIPFVILSQSATDADEPFPESVSIFLRETASQAIYPQSTLAPDLALAFDEDVSLYARSAPRFSAGVFLRTDKESTGVFSHGLSLGDAARMARKYDDYFRLASLFQIVVTDRLHFAISALILGRETVLLPNSYHKNRGVYEAWLAALGCHWGCAAMTQILEKVGYEPVRIRTEYESYCQNIRPEN